MNVSWKLILKKLTLWNPGKVMYIGGSDVLPAPVTAEEEKLLPLLEENVRRILTMSKGQAAEKRLEQLWTAGLGQGFKLLPYSALGVENGLLLAFRLDSAQIGKREIRGAAAVLSPQPMSGGEYSAIVSGEI